jgi:hypothetical protein
VTVWGALAGGAVGATIVAAGLRVAQETGWTRMDLPLLLGTAFTEDRSRASALGYLAHLVGGLLFALGYYGVFAAVGRAGWLFGLLLGVVHAAILCGGLVNVVLPALHPRMGTPWTEADETPLLEAPGFMLANYGPRTAAVTLVLHLAFGAVVGGFSAGL